MKRRKMALHCAMGGTISISLSVIGNFI